MCEIALEARKVEIDEVKCGCVRMGWVMLTSNIIIYQTLVSSRVNPEILFIIMMYIHTSI